MWTTGVTNRLLGKYHNCWWPGSCVARASAVMIYSKAELPIQTVWLSGSSSVNNDLDPNLFLVYIRHYVFQIVISIERLLAHLNKISIPLDTFQCPICWCILKLPKFIVWGVFKTASNWAIYLKYMAIFLVKALWSFLRRFLFLYTHLIWKNTHSVVSTRVSPCEILWYVSPVWVSMIRSKSVWFIFQIMSCGV